MGYHVTILRTANGREVPIPLEEAVAAADAVDGWRFMSATSVFEFRSDQGVCTLWYAKGVLWAKSPEMWEIELMLELAGRLNARARGDEFETYESSGKTYLHPDDVELRKQAEAETKVLLAPHLKMQQLIRLGIVAFFLAIGVIAFVIGRAFEAR